MKNIKSLPYFVFTIVLAVLISAPVESIAECLNNSVMYDQSYMIKNVFIAIVISFNIPMLLTYITRSIIWFIKEGSMKSINKYSFFEYVILCEDLIITTITTISFTLFNCVIMLIVTFHYILSLL